MPEQEDTSIVLQSSHSLFTKISAHITASKQSVAVTVNRELLLLYWQIGNTIREEILHKSRASYGDQIVATLSQQLKSSFGSGFSKSGL